MGHLDSYFHYPQPQERNYKRCDKHWYMRDSVDSPPPGHYWVWREVTIITMTGAHTPYSVHTRAPPPLSIRDPSPLTTTTHNTRVPQFWHRYHDLASTTTMGTYSGHYPIDLQQGDCFIIAVAEKNTWLWFDETVTLLRLLDDSFQGAYTASSIRYSI